MPSVMTPPGDWFRTIAESLNIDYKKCRRIIIDAQVNCVTRVYIEQFASTSHALKLVPPDVSEIQVQIVGKETP